MDPQTPADATTTRRSRPRTVSLLFFFIAVFVVTWIVWIPRALASQGLIDSDLALTVGQGWTYAPALTAIAFLALTGGRKYLTELRRSLLLWRIGWRWYAAIVVIPLGIALSTAVIYKFMGGQFGQGLPLAFQLPLPLVPLILAVRVMTDGIGEETAWRGVALPRLLQRTNAVTASVILGIIWALWHLPLIFTNGATMAHNSISLLLALLPAQAVVYTWIYQHTKQSLFAAAMFHGLIGLWAITSPAAEATGQPELIRVILWWAGAVTLIAIYGLNLNGRAERQSSVCGEPAQNADVEILQRGPGLDMGDEPSKAEEHLE